MLWATLDIWFDQRRIEVRPDRLLLSGGIFGHDVVTDGKAARKSLGVVPQEIALYEDLPAIENLRYWGKAYGLRGKALEDRVTEVLEHVREDEGARAHVMHRDLAVQVVAVERRKLDVLGRERKLARIAKRAKSGDKDNLLLLGPTGCGKTFLVEALST